jgi:putative ATP-dependent endonuclease of the OLD family
MYLSRIKIQNFRNFCDLDVMLGGNIVIVGENRVGKSNLLFGVTVGPSSIPAWRREAALEQ